MLNMDSPYDTATPLLGGKIWRHMSTHKIVCRRSPQHCYLTENGKPAECSSSTVEQKNKVWSIHTTEECATMRWMEYHYSLQHGWILETVRSANEASHKSANSVWFHLHEMSGIGKSTEAESRSVAARAGEMAGKRWVTDMGTGLLPGVVQIFCSCGGGLHTSVTIQKASNGTA